MTEYYSNLHAYILPLGTFLASFVLGWIFEKIVILQLRRLAAKTTWEGDDIIIDSLKGMLFAIFIAAGIYFALMYLDLSPKIMLVAQKGFSAVIIFILTVISSRIAGGFVTKSTATMGKNFPASSILKNVVKIVVFVIGMLVILNNLNIAISPILTALGVGGLAVALALQPTLSNLFSGIQIIASKQLSPGQYISLESGQEGFVQDITWRYTEIKSPTNNMFIIPNSKISEAIITNFYKPEKELLLVVPARVSFNINLEEVEKIAIEAGRTVIEKHSSGIKNFEPLVRFAKFGDWGIEFNLIVKVKEHAEQFVIRHEIIKELNKRFMEKNIAIPTPAMLTKN